MAGRNFGLTNIYLKLGLGMMLLGAAIFAIGVVLGPRMHQFPWMANIALVLIPIFLITNRISRATESYDV